MFYPFKPGRARPVSARANQKAAWRLYRQILSIQRRCAASLSLKASKLSPKALISISTGLLLLASVSCAWLVHEGLSGPGSRLPDPAGTPVGSPRRPTAPFDGGLEQYLDSLERALTRDSIQNSLQNP